MTRPTRLGKSTGSSVYMPVKAREDPIPSVILSTVAATMNNHPSGKSCRNLHTWVKTQLTCLFYIYLSATIGVQVISCVV